MAVLKSKNNNEILIDCNCGCDTGVRFRIDRYDSDYYCIMTYTNGSFYRDQDDTLLKVLRKKLKKILAIIRNKDLYYADIMMTKDEFDEFREYINSI